MKIAFCQYAPVHKDVDANFSLVEEWLEGIDAGSFDILMLPEMCFTGYTFESPEAVEPLLEPKDGRTVQWAQRTARRLACWVAVGFPLLGDDGKRYNAMCVVDRADFNTKIYRKHFLFEADEKWAEPGPSFCAIPDTEFGTVGLGICMDLNPYRFEADFYLCEFANFHLTKKSNLILCCMAWLKGFNPEAPEEDDGSKLLSYWIHRLRPLDRSGAMVVIANRTGKEDREFAGYSAIIHFRESGVEVGHCSDHEGLFVLEVEP